MSDDSDGTVIDDAPLPEDAATEGPDATAAAVDHPGDEAPEGAADAAADEVSFPEFVVVDVMHVTFDLPGPSPVIHLRETVSPYRGIEFPIGLPEAQSIAMAIGKETGPRPTAHELFATVLAAAGTDVIAVRLTSERGGTLIAELDLMTPKGREVVDCRPSDGIGIALRQAVPAPILADAALLD